MKLVDHMAPGDLTLREDCRFAGMVGGNLTVAAGVRAEVVGMVNGDLILEPGARLGLRGVVQGDLVNRGGTVTDDVGMVAGQRRAEP